MSRKGKLLIFLGIRKYILGLIYFFIYSEVLLKIRGNILWDRYWIVVGNILKDNIYGCDNN